MNLGSLLEHTVSVSRLVASTGIKQTFRNVATDVPCIIQPLNPEAVETTTGFGTDYKGFFQVDADIREGDRLTDQVGRVFSVRGIRLRNYGPAHLQHLEALLGQDRSEA
jgi:hypothetical protein